MIIHYCHFVTPLHILPIYAVVSMWAKTYTIHLNYLMRFQTDTIHAINCVPPRTIVKMLFITMGILFETYLDLCHQVIMYEYVNDMLPELRFEANSPNLNYLERLRCTMPPTEYYFAYDNALFTRWIAWWVQLIMPLMKFKLKKKSETS